MNTADREKIERYITDTPINKQTADSYCVRVGELRVLREMIEQDTYQAICLIFAYGRAKGYRAAKAEARASKT